MQAGVRRVSEPVIIVGAPRSGTNMLRDVLTALPGMETWNCDEINLIWRHGNISLPHDELTRADARPEVVAYLQRFFRRFAERSKADTVVEKTCATSLRVAFAARVFPEAKFLFIRRDGMDATASAMQRWNAPLALRYTLRKARYVPARDFPVHATEFARRRLRQRFGGTAQAAEAERMVDTWWGPKPHDYQRLQEQHALAEVAFIQWQRCVERTREDLASLEQGRSHEVVYEEFVQDPVRGLADVLEFLGRSDLMDPEATDAVRSTSVGKGRSQLGAETVRSLESIGGKTLTELGYV